MSVFCITNEYVSINGSVLSTYVKAATLAVEADQLDSTTMGDTWKESTGGLKSGTLTIEFLDDVAAAALDSIWWPLFGTTVAFEVRADAGAVGPSNPKWTGSVFVGSHSVGGKLGELAGKAVTLPTSGTVTRATS